MRFVIKSLIAALAKLLIPAIYVVLCISESRSWHVIRQILRMTVWGVKLNRLGDNSVIYPYVVMHSPQRISIGANVSIAEFVHMWGGGGIEIGDHVMIASHVVITSQTHNVDPETRRTNVLKSVIINENVWIGSHSIILPGIHIGKNSVIAAGSVVTKNVPEGALMGGVPAKLLGDGRVERNRHPCESM